MCTRVLWSDSGDKTGNSVLVGRNMDFFNDLRTNLWKQPRGVQRSDGVSEKLSWTSTYGSLVATCFDITSVDGINEAGLAGHVLWLTESTYGEPDDSRPQLSQAIWLQYFLDNFATVAQAVAWIAETDLQVVQMTSAAFGENPGVHLALNDATGDSAIIEYLDGHAHVYHSREYTVMTNSPTYDKQLELVKSFTGLGGDKPIPGGTDAWDRFARASYYLTRLPAADSQVDAIAAVLSVIRNAAQPFRIPDPGKPEASQTLWQVVADLTHRRYVYESTTQPNIVWVDLDDLDFAEGSGQLKLDLVGELAIEGGIAGNVSANFEDKGPMTFLSMKIIAEQAAAAKPKAT